MFIEVPLIGIQLVDVDQPRFEVRTQLEQYVGWWIQHQALTHQNYVLLVVEGILPN